MTGAAEDSSTHIWSAEALKLLAAAYGSIATAERVLMRELKAGRIPWTAKDVDPPGTPIDGLWQKGTLKAHLAQNEATFLELFVLSGGPPDTGWNTIKVGGIQFERAAIAALLPADVAELASPLPSLPAIASSTEQSPSPFSDPRTAKVTRRAWLEAYLTEDRKTELANEYRTVGAAATAIHETMQADPTVEPYRNARIIEPHLEGLFPRRRKPK